MTSTPGVWRSGTGKVLHVGDFVRLDGSTSGVYRITGIHPSGIDVYGGKPGRLATRTFAPERLSRYRAAIDPNEPLREALHEVSVASKAKRRGVR